MREIKFRAWDNREKRMVPVCPTPAGPAFYDNVARSAFAYVAGVVSEPMQYTGLKDANGVEIFEGDILRSENMFLKDRPVVVEFENGRFIGRCAPNKLGIEGLRNLTDQPAEVIGNIYEHSHLMSGVEGE